MTRAAIGIGSNLGDPRANVLAAFDALASLGEVNARSSLYRTKPWGKENQPDFCNAVALLETQLEPRGLLDALKTLESVLGREAGERWGHRVIDLDILLFGERRIDEPGLHVPHPRLLERGFALIPLAQVDPAWSAAIEGLALKERESVALMSQDQIVERVRTLAQVFLQTDLMRLRIEEANEDAIELRRKPAAAAVTRLSEQIAETGASPPQHLEAIKADLVGILHVSRPPVKEGSRLDADRELAYVEALGIRTPVRSLGAGRIAAIRCKDGQPVEYGQVLFEIDRA